MVRISVAANNTPVILLAAKPASIEFFRGVSAGRILVADDPSHVITLIKQHKLC